MKVGIIGLEFSGKKSLFRLLTGIKQEHFSADKREIGVINVPDQRIDYVAQFYNSTKTVYSQIEFDLISSIKKDSEETKKALMEAKEVDMFGLVIRQFKDENVFHPFDSIDINRDFNIIKDELVLADLLLIETRLERIEKQLKIQKKDQLIKEKELLLRIKTPLEAGTFLKDTELNEDESKIISGFQLLTLKPVFIIVNCEEEKLNEDFKFPDKFKSINISVKIENEIQQLSESERGEFLDSLGLKESCLNRLIKFAYDYGELISFFTATEKEAHSWTIISGTSALHAAGVIHSDFEKGFIRAEVVHFDDLKKAGSEAEAKKQGLHRLEGKDYIVKDGDVILFRFNV